MTLASKHGLVTTLFAVIAVLAALYAVSSGVRAASIIVIGMGAAVLLVFLVVDLPDVDSVGLYNVAGAGNLDATGTASAGLWMELTGAIILILGGLAMATLNSEQLTDLRPGTSPARPASTDE